MNEFFVSVQYGDKIKSFYHKILDDFGEKNDNVFNRQMARETRQLQQMPLHIVE